MHTFPKKNFYLKKRIISLLGEFCHIKFPCLHLSIGDAICNCDITHAPPSDWPGAIINVRHDWFSL